MILSMTSNTMSADLNTSHPNTLGTRFVLAALTKVRITTITHLSHIRRIESKFLSFTTLFFVFLSQTICIKDKLKTCD